MIFFKTNKYLLTSILVSIFFVFISAFFLLQSSFKIFVIETPSMGKVSPVGSLVLTQNKENYNIGDVITFKKSDRLYTHRIVDNKDNKFVTKGDINGYPDPWLVENSQIIGSSILVLPFVGSLLKLVPTLIISCLIILIISQFIKKPSHHFYFLIYGTVLVLTIILIFSKLLVNYYVMNYTVLEDSLAKFQIINTGILPLTRDNQIIFNGEIGEYIVSKDSQSNSFLLYLSPYIFGNWWFLIAFISLFPSFVAYLVYLAYDFWHRQKNKIEESKRNLLVIYEEKASKIPLFLKSFLNLKKVYKISLLIAVLFFLSSLTIYLINGIPFSKSIFVSAINNSKNTAGSRTWFNCNSAILGTSNRVLGWTLSNPGAVENDISGNGYNATSSGTKSLVNSFGCVRDNPQQSVNFQTNRCINPNNSVNSISNPSTFSLEAWFLTTTKQGGVILGFSQARTGVTSTVNDRQIYIDKDGRVVFALGNPTGTQYILASPAGADYANGQWHHVVATFSGGITSLYLDGNLVANTSGFIPRNYSGWWRAGCGRLQGWRNGDGTVRSTVNYYTGYMQYASVYTKVLTPLEVSQHYLAGAL